MDHPFFHLIIYTPVEAADAVRKALAQPFYSSDLESQEGKKSWAGAGKIGAYDSCSFSTKGTGRFRPLEGSDPHIGSEGELEAVEEEKIEVLVPKEIIAKVVHAVKEVHPYEEPAMHVLPMVDYKSFE